MTFWKRLWALATEDKCPHGDWPASECGGCFSDTQWVGSEASDHSRSIEAQKQPKPLAPRKRSLSSPWPSHRAGPKLARRT